MRQIFDDGVFYGAFHPEELPRGPNGELFFLGFGLIGVLRHEKRDLRLKMLITIVAKDVDGVSRRLYCPRDKGEGPVRGRFKDTRYMSNSINTALRRVSQGSFTFKIAHDDLDRLGNSLDRASYKILFGLVMASIVIGMSLVVLATQSVMTVESFQITVAVYTLAVFVGIYSVVQLIRERDKR